MNSSVLMLLFVHIFLLFLLAPHFGFCKETECIGRERETLLKLKDHLIDPSNRLSSWNATAIPNCCQWAGVVCNNLTSHIAELHLNTPLPTFDESLDDPLYEEAYEEAYEEYTRRAFGGEINPCLVDLKHLNNLDFSGNLFQTMPFPSFLATMTSLTHLNLSHVEFMGNISSQIGNLSNLLYLDLSYLNHGRDESPFIENIDWLSSLSKLHYLDLSSIPSLGGGMPIPSFVWTMSTLIHLDLSNSGFMGNIPPQIGNLSNLLYLDLSHVANGTIPSQIGNLSYLLYLDLSQFEFESDQTLFNENVDWLSSLSKLRYLHLSSNPLLGGGMPIPSFVGTMSTLIHLDLSDSGFIGNIPPQIGNLSNLVYLNLGYVYDGTIPSQIGNLSNLLYLDLRSRYYDYQNVDWLPSLSKLEYLYLEGANLSQSSHCFHTFQALPSLMHLSLSRCTLPHYNQPSFSNISSLHTLYLGEINHSSSISFVVKWVFGLNKLVSLTSVNNYIEGPIPDGLRNLTLLENLVLYMNSFSSSIPDWFFYSLPRLKFLDLSQNNLQGTISDAIGNVTCLVTLDLSFNQLEGPIPTSLGYLYNLREIDFSGNKIGGELPRSLGKLSLLSILILHENRLCGNPFESLKSLFRLSYLDIRDNYFQGVVTEDHLANVWSLREFYASRNNLTLKVGPNWNPTFQLTNLDMSFWKLGPNFPSWIHSQNKLQYLVMFNTEILDSIPSWFWETFSQCSHLDLSHNHIHGELGTTLTNPISVGVVDLSANKLCGKLPFLSKGVELLDLSNNSFSKSMDDFLCKCSDKIMQLKFLNLALNNLSGEIPDCWGFWLYLVDVNLQSNNFVGNFPPSVGSLVELESLRIRNNSLSGTFPTILKMTNKLILLDLGENKFSGTIPSWVGKSLLYMKVLILRSNRFLGHIPNKICDMSSLQVLDLAQNNLTGKVPTCFNSLEAMTMTQNNESMHSLISCNVVNYRFMYGGNILGVLLWLKGREDEYKNFLGLVRSIDLSNNQLVGEIPTEITYLKGLIFLNLSHNQLSGHIPRSIGSMESLLSIDFSKNQLYGEIPLTIANLSSLSMLNLSYNHLKGKIPIGPQLQTFDISNFIGNNLCGPPLPINCSFNEKNYNYDHNGKRSDRHIVNWFLVSMTFGFVMGFWIVVGPLFICRSWRYAYFHFLDHMWFKLQYLF